ncbi:MAG TPA: aminotransferase class IV [Phycisphaerales bacterium]|nr:aminotransferase class IV [Phycisphaerales bacterium]HMP36874.1 aminotransferase class IV [Phycisphaerales bacterium]
MLAWLDGTVLPVEDARVPILDRGFLFGDGVYELVRFFGGVGVQMDDHVQRLRRSLRASRIEGFDAASMPLICRTLLDAAGLRDASVYLQVTRGVAPSRHHVPPRGMKPTVAAFAAPMCSLPEFAGPEPVEAVLIEEIRWKRCDIKTISLMGNVLALLDAEERLAEVVGPGGAGPTASDARASAGADDAPGAALRRPFSGFEAILHRGGRIAEGTSTNVLARFGDRLATPPVDADPPILHGVTRLLAEAAAAESGFAFEHRPIDVEELRCADEIMLLSSRRIVASVLQLDGRPVGEGACGPAAATLFAAARRRIAAQCGIALPDAIGSAAVLAAP